MDPDRPGNFDFSSAGIDPALATRIHPFLEGLYRYYFRCGFEGWENVPSQQCLFVGNHNGLLTFEVLMLFHAWWNRYGDSRKVLGLAHGVALRNPAFSWLIPKIGAIPADPEIAVQAMQAGYSLMVYPGGEKESFRPFTERKKVNFYQRKGFIRLALRARVPIVPIVSVGAHESYVIFHRGEELAERLGLKKHFRMHGLPLTARTAFFAWCVATGIFTFFPLLLAPGALVFSMIPLPAKMDFIVLPAVDPTAMIDPSLTEEQNHQTIYDHILTQMQTTLTHAYAKRRLPILG